MTATPPDVHSPAHVVLIGDYPYDDYLELARKFHGYAAPGLIVGGFMVAMARRMIPEGVLFDAIAETSSCLPDAVQMLTPCTAGNGWLKVRDLGRYALTLFNKHTGEGWRVVLDPARLDGWPEYRDWYLKRKTKKEQDSDRLREEMRLAGESVLSIAPVMVNPELVGKSSKGAIAVCPLCAEAYPARHGAICLGCQGEAPTAARADGSGEPPAAQTMDGPRLATVATTEAVGKTALHDMTRIVPGQSKGAEFRRGQQITVGDVCRLQLMGKNSVFVVEEGGPGAQWIHEDQAALDFAARLCADGSLAVRGQPREGKVTLIAAQDGLFTAEPALIEAFNLVPGVMLATRHAFAVVKKGDPVAATRAIPLYLHAADHARALAVLDRGAPLAVKPMRKPVAGLCITGTEIFQGLVQDRFEPILTRKIEAFGGRVAKALILPDDRAAIAAGVRELLDAGADLIVTTAGLSVDPDDVTRLALVDAGARNLRYGMPVLPGAMSLLGEIGEAQLLGVPACALFHAATSLDLILPRLLAGISPTRRELARMGHGSFCLECKVCVFPHCPFGK